MFQVIYEVGCRVGEFVKIQVKHLNFSRSTVYFPAENTKTKHPPLLPYLFAIFTVFGAVHGVLCLLIVHSKICILAGGRPQKFEKNLDIKSNN